MQLKNVTAHNLSVQAIDRVESNHPILLQELHKLESY